jgi:hypothetical protein
LRIRIYGRAPSDAARSNRRFKKAVSGILHKANPISRGIILIDAAPRYPLLDGKLKVERIKVESISRNAVLTARNSRC